MSFDGYGNRSRQVEPYRRWGFSQSIPITPIVATGDSSQLVNVLRHNPEVYGILLASTLDVNPGIPGLIWQYNIQWTLFVGIGQANVAIPYVFAGNSALAFPATEDFTETRTGTLYCFREVELPLQSLQITAHVFGQTNVGIDFTITVSAFVSPRHMPITEVEGNPQEFFFHPTKDRV